MGGHNSSKEKHKWTILNGLCDNPPISISHTLENYNSPNENFHLTFCSGIKKHNYYTEYTIYYGFCVSEYTNPHEHNG